MRRLANSARPSNIRGEVLAPALAMIRGADQVRYRDIKNTGAATRGHHRSRFLKVFAETHPWIHLDIAGMAWIEENRPSSRRAERRRVRRFLSGCVVTRRSDTES